MKKREDARDYMGKVVEGLNRKIVQNGIDKAVIADDLEVTVRTLDSWLHNVTDCPAWAFDYICGILGYKLILRKEHGIDKLV